MRARVLPGALLAALAWFGAAPLARAQAADACGDQAAAANAWRTSGAAVARWDGVGYLIRSSYLPAAWSGRLERLALAPDGALDLARPLWEAADILTGDTAAARAPRPAPDARKIFTLIHKNKPAAATAPFKWAHLPQDERTHLERAPGAAPDGLGEARLGFLRGERTRETGQPGGVFRRRAGLLGDAMRSTPLLVGAPSLAVQGASYASFHARHKARAPVAYLGANDGLLHAFDARDGIELFAYLPRALLPAVGALADPAYVHRSFVDASAGYGEAELPGGWRSILMSGMGPGARGVFALDVTDPANFETGLGALWEFTEEDDAAIGHVGAPPPVAKIKVAERAGVPQYRWFAVVASGIDNSGPDGALFLLALDKPAATPWKRGTNYFKLEARAGATGLPNALAPPALVVGADGSVRYAYAGDLQGKLWRFDFTGKPPFASQSVYEARDADDQRQPITSAPRVAHAPGGGYLVLFGTGKPVEAAGVRPGSFVQQSFYAIHDRAAAPARPVRGRAELARRTLAGSSRYQVSGAAFEYRGADARRGWFFDFPGSLADGERLTDSPVLAAGTVVINTVVPGRDPCAGAGARTYVLDVLSGYAFTPDGVAASDAQTGDASTGFLGAAPMLIELGAAVGPRNATGRASAIRTYGVLRLRGDGAASAVTPLSVNLPARRFSWREVANWRQLHQASKK